jgi:hypothetical protein
MIVGLTVQSMIPADGRWSCVFEAIGDPPATALSKDGTHFEEELVAWALVKRHDGNGNEVGQHIEPMCLANDLTHMDLAASPSSVRKFLGVKRTSESIRCWLLARPR